MLSAAPGHQRAFGLLQTVRVTFENDDLAVVHNTVQDRCAA